MSNGPGLTRLYKNGMSVDLCNEDIEEALKDGWKDEPQPVTQAASPPAKAAASKELPTTQNSDVKSTKPQDFK